MEFTAEAIRRAERVRLIIFDVDGVLTDGGIYIGPDGELFKTIGDVVFMMGLRYRAKELHITEVYQGNLDKRAAYADLKAKLGLADEEIAYFGDDLVDLPIMGQVGFPAAVADAVQEVREVAVLQSDYPGGHGAVRQLIEFILKAQGKWEDLVAGFQAKKSMEGLAQ